MSSQPQPEIRERPPFFRERQPGAVDDTPNPWLQRPRSVEDWVQLVVWALAPGTILALLGPFGSFLAPIWLRFAYWVPTMAIGVGIGWFINVWADRQPWLCARPWMRIGVVSVVMTVAMSVVVLLWTPVVFGSGAPGPGVMFVFYVWVISVVMGLLGHYYGEYRERRSPAKQEAPATAAQAASAARPATLGQRLKPGLRNEPILALEGEDHYVRVHTAQGSELILMRLADAIAEMGGEEGARTHRSWWVARAAAGELKRVNGRLCILLPGNLTIPVSRAAKAEVARIMQIPD